MDRGAGGGGGPPGSSAHGISQVRILKVGCHALLQGIFPTQGSNLYLLCLLHCRQILYCLANGEAPVSLQKRTDTQGEASVTMEADTGVATSRGLLATQEIRESHGTEPPK